MMRLGVVLAVGTGLAFGQHPSSLTLEEALGVALANSRSLVIAAARLDAARALSDERSAALLPSVKMEASYRRLSDVDPFRVTLPFAPVPVEISPTVLDTYVLRLGLQQPLFTGSRLSGAAESSERLLAASRADLAAERWEIVVAVTAAYWAHHHSLVVKRLAAENLARLESYAADTERLIQAGLATTNDRLRVAVQVSTARIGLIDAEHDVSTSSMVLNNLLGRPLDTPVELASQPQRHGAEGEVKADAVAGRPDIRALEQRVSAARATLASANGAWWPQLSLSGNYVYSRPNSRYMPTRDEFLSTWDVGVVLTMDLWNWGITARQSDQASAALRQAQTILEQARESAALEIERASFAVRRAEQRLQVSDLAVTQADESLRMTNDKYRNGLASSSELLDAQVAALQARTAQAAGLVDAVMARLRLARAAGAPLPITGQADD